MCDLGRSSLRRAPLQQLENLAKSRGVDRYRSILIDINREAARAPRPVNRAFMGAGVREFEHVKHWSFHFGNSVKLWNGMDCMFACSWATSVKRLALILSLST
jgi:hypothetical protein